MAVADCLATNKACHSGVSAGVGTSRMDGWLGAGLHTMAGSSARVRRLLRPVIFPTSLFCRLVPRVLLLPGLPARTEKAVSGCPHLKSLVRSRCGGLQPYQVSRQRLSRPRKCRGTSGHPAGHFSRQIRVSACSGAGKGDGRKGRFLGKCREGGRITPL